MVNREIRTQVLGPRLAEKGLYLLPTILVTKARKRGANFKGGVSSYSKIKRDLGRLLGDSNAAAVTTMMDYYRLPSDFPGREDLPQDGTPYDKVHTWSGPWSRTWGTGGSSPTFPSTSSRPSF